MEEPGMAVLVRESKHPYDNNTNFEVGLWLKFGVQLLHILSTWDSFSGDLKVFSDLNYF